jgi:hypothetical protein
MIPPTPLPLSPFFLASILVTLITSMTYSNEWIDVNREVTHAPQTDAEVAAAMMALDTDGDGFVSWNEFLSVMTVKINGLPSTNQNRSAASPSSSNTSRSSATPSATPAAARPSFARVCSIYLFIIFKDRFVPFVMSHWLLLTLRYWLLASIEPSTWQ